MAKRGRATTQADDLHARLRSDILSGGLAPGDRLKFHSLCDAYGTSVGAAREALTRLVAEGLVRVQPHQGYTVTPLTREDLAELTSARMEVESVTLRLAVEHGDMTWESAIVGAHHALARTPFLSEDQPGRPSEEWTRAHMRFHSALLDACPNRRLLQISQSLREEALLYQVWSVQHEPDRDGADEHRALLEAAIARNAELAAALLREHLQRTARLILDHDLPGLPAPEPVLGPT